MSGQNQGFALHGMLQNVVAAARDRMEKAAAETCPKCGKAECTCPAAVKKDDGEKKASFDYAYIDKLAGATEYIGSHISEVEDGRSNEEKVAEALLIAEAMGFQKTAVGGPDNKDAGRKTPAALVPPEDPSEGKGLETAPGAASNAMANDADDRPGGGGEQPYKHDKAKTLTIPKDTPLTDPPQAAGDSTTAMEADDDKAPGGNTGSVPTAGYPAEGPIREKGAGVIPDRYAGVLSKMAELHAVAAPVEEAPAEKTSAPTPVLDYVLAKLAEDSAKTNVSAGTTGTTVDGGKFPGTPAEEGVPKEQKPAQASMVASNQAVIDATKREAKAPQKEDLGKVLDEPALSKATDSKLQENLTATNAAGAKIAEADDIKVAAARELFRRVLNGEDGPEKEAALKKVMQKLATELPTENSEVPGTQSQYEEEAQEDQRNEGTEQDFADILEAAAQAQGEELTEQTPPASAPDVPASV